MEKCLIWTDFKEEQSANRSVDQFTFLNRITSLDLRVNRHLAQLVGHDCLVHRRVWVIGSLCFPVNIGDVINTKHNVLCCTCCRLPICRLEQIVRRQHNFIRFMARLGRQRYVYCHLVTVEVSVERRSYHWMDLNSLTFNQHWLECLDTKAMQGRSTVQEYLMCSRHIFKRVPYFRYSLFDQTAGRTNVMRKFSFN